MTEDEDKIIELLNFNRTVISLDTPLDIDDSESSTLGDTIQDNSYSPEDISVESEINRTIRSIMDSSLTAEEQKIIKLRFGFDCECSTYDSMSKMYGITKQGVKEREKRIIRKLSKHTEIIQLKKDMRIDEKTNFYKKGRNPVLSNVLLRDNERMSLDIKYDHPFYVWYFNLLKERKKIKNAIDYYGQDELEEVEFKIDAVKQSLIFTEIDMDNVCGWKIVKDKLEDRKPFDYKATMKLIDCRIQELDVINSIIDILKYNNIYVDMDEHQVPVFYK